MLFGCLMTVCWTEKGLREIRVSLLALLLLLLFLLDTCRSSCETSFPRFALIQPRPNLLLALAALPRAALYPTLPSRAPLSACSTSPGARSALPASQTGCEGMGSGPFPLKKKFLGPVLPWPPSFLHLDLKLLQHPVLCGGFRAATEAPLDATKPAAAAALMETGTASGWAGEFGRF